MYFCTSSCDVYQNRHLGCNKHTSATSKKEKLEITFFVQEITSPTSNPYMYFVSFIIDNQPSVECVELQCPTVLQ